MADGYDSLAQECRSLLSDSSPTVSKMANFSALVFHSVPEINWCGFYLAQHECLSLGPFQGRVACTQIEFGKGVCGTAARERRTLLVDDVDQFPGHIVCDAASRSELVIPLVAANTLLGVFDVDAPVPGRFGPEDQQGFEGLIDIFIDMTQAENLARLAAAN